MGSGLCKGVFSGDFHPLGSCLSVSQLSIYYPCPVHHLVLFSGSGLVALSHSPEVLNLSPIVFLLSPNLINLFSSNIILFFPLPRYA